MFVLYPDMATQVPSYTSSSSLSNSVPLVNAFKGPNRCKGQGLSSKGGEGAVPSPAYLCTSDCSARPCVVIMQDTPSDWWPLRLFFMSFLTCLCSPRSWHCSQCFLSQGMKWWSGLAYLKKRRASLSSWTAGTSSSLQSLRASTPRTAMFSHMWPSSLETHHHPFHSGSETLLGQLDPPLLVFWSKHLWHPPAADLWVAKVIIDNFVYCPNR